jgi:hypothetical protein
VTGRAPLPTVECGCDALRALDDLLQGRSESLDATLIAANRCLVRYRDALIERLRTHPGDAHLRNELQQANATVSLVFGTHYPLVGIQWDRLKKTRQAMAELMAEAPDPE